MSSSDLVNRQSAEHNLIVWDTKTGAKISNQIYHVSYHVEMQCDKPQRIMLKLLRREKIKSQASLAYTADDDS